jgi:pimeloyl-ACP methyl ester carboxylesterase
VFGHSFGGLVALQAARQNAFAQIAVFEPAVSIGRSIPMGWLAAYERRLAAGDARGAFVAFVRGSGHAPAFLTRMPNWYVGLVLRVAFRGASWRRMKPLLTANLLEHREVARFDGDLEYGEISAPVLVLAGGRSPGVQTNVLQDLRAYVPSATVEVMPGLGHRAPQGRSAKAVADRVSTFFASARSVPSAL